MLKGYNKKGKADIDVSELPKFLDDLEITVLGKPEVKFNEDNLPAACTLGTRFFFCLFFVPWTPTDLHR